MVSYIIGYIYAIGFIDYEPGYRLVFLIVFVLWVSALYYLRARSFSIKEELESYFVLLCLVIVGVASCLELGTIAGDYETWIFSSQFMHGLAIYWVLMRAGRLVGGVTGRFFLLDMFSGYVIIPFRNWFLRTLSVVSLVGDGVKQRKSGRKILPSVLAIVGALCLLFLVISILSGTDENFAEIFSLQLPSLDGLYLFYLILSLPIGCFLFGLVYGAFNKQNRPDMAYVVEASVGRLRTVGGRTLTAILYLFSAVYVVYILLQASYFVGGFYGQLPQDFTYSEYARRGFFELCVVMGINLCILFVVAKISANPLREHSALKIASLIFLIICMFFAITAASKLLLYIDAYGFTALRLMSSWAILLLAVAIVLSFITILRPIKAVRILVYYAIASYAVVSLL